MKLVAGGCSRRAKWRVHTFGRERQQGLLLQIITYSEQYLKKDLFWQAREGEDAWPFPSLC